MKWKRDPAVGILSESGICVGGFARLNPNDQIPNCQHHFVAFEVKDHGRKPSFRRRYESHICTLQQLSQEIVYSEMIWTLNINS